MPFNRILLTFWVVLLGVLVGSTIAWSTAEPQPPVPTVTILCYMNGDNDLAEEVLHALDMMETVGSSDQVNVIALVDGHPRWLGPYDDQWAETRLLRIEADPVIGKIGSPVLETWGEANLGAPETLERFIRIAIERYPAQRYIFYTFAHGQGIIDTRALSLPSPAKALSISRDDSDGAKMKLGMFQRAIRKGLGQEKFDLMVLFSCLSGMAEVTYALSNLTDYLIASEDEIRLLNSPVGTYQLRGLEFETLIADLHRNPAEKTTSLARRLVDSHVRNYGRDLQLSPVGETPRLCRFSGSMTLINGKVAGSLTRLLDDLATMLIRYANHPAVVTAFRQALTDTQTFASFLNLEYYDLLGFIQHLSMRLPSQDLKMACDRITQCLQERVIVYERHSTGHPGTGLSIYLSHPLVPENIYHAHQRMYQACSFSQDTHWDEMIDTFRRQINVRLTTAAPAQSFSPQK